MHPTIQAVPRPGLCRVVSVSLSPETIRSLEARLDATPAAGQTSSFSAEIRRAVAEADGNAARLRHDLRGHLNNITLAVQLLRGTVRRREDTEALDAIARATASIAATVAAPTQRKGIPANLPETQSAGAAGDVRGAGKGNVRRAGEGADGRDAQERHEARCGKFATTENRQGPRPGRQGVRREREDGRPRDEGTVGADAPDAAALLLTQRRGIVARSLRRQRPHRSADELQGFKTAPRYLNDGRETERPAG